MNDREKTVEERSKPLSKGEETSPVHVVRRGAIAASIWKRQANSGYAYYDFSLSRSWKSMSSNKTGYSKNFFADHAKELAEVIAETAAWIEARKSENQAAAAPGTLAA